MDHDADTAYSSLFPGVPRDALVGSHPVVNLVNPPEPNGEERPPPVPVSTPDVAIQTIPCISVLLSSEASNQFYRGLGKLGDDVRHQCAPVPGTTAEVETIGIWERAASSAEAEAARIRALQELRIVDGGLRIAFLYTQPFLSRMLGKVFDSMPTKSFDEDGTPNPDGAVHITGISLELRYPNQIVTIIDGLDERPFPDVNFQSIATDTLSINNNTGTLVCNSVIQTNADLDWFQELMAVLFSSILGLIATTPSATNTAVDCWAEMLAPPDIPISGGQKIIMTYEDVQVTYEGVVITAALPTTSQPRMFTAEIIGSRNLRDTVGNGAVGSTYYIELHDFLEPVQVEWLIDSNLVAEGEGQRFLSRNITFLAPEGMTEVRRLKVKAEDADQKTAGDEISVTVSSRPPRGPRP